MTKSKPQVLPCAGALATFADHVQSKYIAPLLRDQTVKILAGPTDRAGYVFCATMDVEVTASGRRYPWLTIPAREQWVALADLVPVYTVGMRVELSPACDLWMRGAKFGTIAKLGADWSVYVRMDHPSVRKLQHITDLTYLVGAL